MSGISRASKSALLALAILAQAALPASAAEAHVNGAELGAAWAVPFAGLLLSIAIFPLLAPHWWHHHYGKIAAGWSLSFLVPFAALHGAGTAVFEFLHVILLDYVPFIAVLFALYTISGGVFLAGRLHGSPRMNTLLLAGGTLIASIVGTTGASVLLIRPLLRANAHRTYNVHVVVFFIFLVSNIGGSLSPLGDPPLYIGFLKGVDFFWPAQFLWSKMLPVAAILLGLFFVIDSFVYRRDQRKMPRDTSPELMKLHVKGWRNVILLGAVIAVILLSAFWHTDLSVELNGVHLDAPNILRVIALLALAAISLLVTPQAYRKGNNFTWGPIAEVGKLFAGIFVTIVPVIAMLQAGKSGAFAPVLSLVTKPDGSPDNAMYFWLTGGLSSFLDNAPTYLVFFNAAGGDPQALMGPMSSTLAAISAGAVFMGANTYIGNAPNLMVKAIAEDRNVKMPGFFGYMLWSGCVLIPLFVVMTFIWFK